MKTDLSCVSPGFVSGGSVKSISLLRSSEYHPQLPNELARYDLQDATGWDMDGRSKGPDRRSVNSTTGGPGTFQFHQGQAGSSIVHAICEAGGWSL